MNNDIEKAKERCKELTIPERNCWIGISNQTAITTVLNYIEQLEKTIKELQEMKKEILTDDLGGKYNIYRDNKTKELEKERDYYKKMYLEFNDGVLAGMKIIEKRDNNK